jgi:dolichol-phosphate mannosyltransferase
LESKINQQQNGLVSIIIPTYNESKNILNILKSIKENIPQNISAEAIVVDDNSPDGTGKIVDEYLRTIKNATNYTIDIIHRKTKSGLSSAILNGIENAKGETILVMDSDFSHPPQIIPKMIEALKKSHSDIVVASRYVSGGGIKKWSLKRKFLSKFANKIAKKFLGIKINDPMSGYFAFKRGIINELNFDAIGYKMLTEILVKTKGAKVKEIPYTFTDRTEGKSKLDLKIILDYLRSVWKLYQYGQSMSKHEKRNSVNFLYKAGRFYTIGASGLALNLTVSYLFSNGFNDSLYLYANAFGIISSMISNFVLNKYWTFEDRDFSIKRTIKQLGKFVTFSSLGAAIQLGLVFTLVENSTISYPIALVIAVAAASFGNFVMNKKWTFKEKLWS